MSVDLAPGIRGAWCVGGGLLCAALLVAWPVHAIAQEPAPDRRDQIASNSVEHCKANLNRIFEAIVEYRRVCETWPKILSDLHPEFISDLNSFICPAILHDGAYGLEALSLRAEVLEDPIPTSYTYEFNLKKYQLWAGIARTDREFKLGQMEVVGSNVPIVRCMKRHYPNLALTVGGGIFETRETDWEGDAITNLVPGIVLRYLAPTPGRFVEGIPPRDSGTDVALVDLSHHYTSGIRTPWLWRNLGHDFSALKLGTVRFGALPTSFDVRGVIQLASTNMVSPFPKSADNIGIAKKARYLHFIEGAVMGEPYDKRRVAPVSGTEVGRYNIHFDSGESVTVPIRYGHDVLVFDDANDPSGQMARVAWEGRSRFSKSGPRFVRLYHQRWENPRPDVVIKSLDFVSNMAGPAPFLVAVTVEP